MKNEDQMIKNILKKSSLQAPEKKDAQWSGILNKIERKENANLFLKIVPALAFCLALVISYNVYEKVQMQKRDQAVEAFLMDNMDYYVSIYSEDNSAI